MSTRLPTGGRLIDRAKTIRFRFDGKHMSGFAGDTLSAALLANDRMLIGRSFKYHRPRGVIASGAEEPNGLVTLGRGARLEPNQRVTTTELFDGLRCESQNHWPSLDHDIGVVNAALSRFLPAGFYYKMFMHPRSFWKHVYEPVIRAAAGLGRAPRRADPDTYEHFHTHVDVAVVGGGIAGLRAALTAARNGARVMLMEQTAHWGGRAPVDGDAVDGKGAKDWIAETLATLREMDNVTLRTRCMGAGVHDHGSLLAYEQLGDHLPDHDGPRHRLWRIRARQIVTATGAIERPLSFACNDVPGVMLAAAVRDYIVNFAVAPGDAIVVVTNNDDAYLTAFAAKAAGLSVPAIIDARPEGGAFTEKARAQGLRVETGKAVAKVKGGKRVTGVALCRQDGDGSVSEEIPCTVVAMSGGWSPVVHLWSHCGGKLTWDDGQSHFRPDPARAPTGDDGRPFVITAGAASGALSATAALADADAAGRIAAARAGGDHDTMPTAPDADAATASMPVWVMPQGAGDKLRTKMWLDYQNDVKVSDIQLAAQEG